MEKVGVNYWQTLGALLDTSPALSDSACDMLIYMLIHCQYYGFTDTLLSTLPLLTATTFVL